MPVDVQKLVEDFEKIAQRRREEWERVNLSLEKMEVDEPSIVGVEFIPFDELPQNSPITPRQYRQYVGLLKRRDTLGHTIEMSMLNAITVHVKWIEAAMKIGNLISLTTVNTVISRLVGKALRRIPQAQHPIFMGDMQELRTALEREGSVVNLHPILEAVVKPKT